jgi:hypothetical protein
MNDNDVLSAVATAMAGVPARRPVDAIVARGRVHRRRRWALTAAMAGITAGAALVLGLPALGGSAPPSSATAGAASAGTSHVRMVGFMLDGNADGTIQLTLSHEQAADPAVLERELGKVGVRAKVSIGKHCVDQRGSIGGVRDVVKEVRAGDHTNQTAVWVIAPKAIPPGAHLNVTLIPRDGPLIGFLAAFGLMADDASPACTEVRVPAPQPSHN